MNGRRVTPCVLILCLWSVSLCAHAQGVDTELATDTTLSEADYAAGHGTFSLELARSFYHGDYQGPAGADSGQDQFHQILFEGTYFVADHWELRASIPFTQGKVDGLQAHPQLPCPPPGGTLSDCVPIHIDDGNYHGTWADWDFGVRYHTVIGDNYDLTPTFDLYVPSHNYPFYGSNVVGQRVTKYGFGAELEHQFDFSNFYYSLQYQYVIKPVVLGFNSNYNDLGVNVGYFINPNLGVRLITDIKYGRGLADAELNSSLGMPPDFNDSPYWPLHDKIRKQNHALVGSGLDYTITPRYRVSFTALTSVWGQSNARLSNDAQLRLTYSF